MPYVFPYETLFLWIISLLILGLLGLRLAVTVRRRQQGKSKDTK